MSAITVGGDLVHYEVLGRGRPVILVHGWVGSWRYWIPIMQQLHLKYRVYALDLFGFGDSAKNPERYSIDQQVHLLEEFMDQLGVAKTALIGHGLGAQVAVEFTRQYSDKVARLMIASAPLFSPGNLDKRVPPGQQVLLTTKDFNAKKSLQELERAQQAETLKTAPPVKPNIPSVPAPSEVAPDVTLMRRPDLIIGPTSNTDATIPNAKAIDRAALEAAALARAEAEIKARKSGVDIAPSAPETANNELYQRVGRFASEALLTKCFKRSEPEYEKLTHDVAKTDSKVLSRSAVSFDAGRMLDTLRVLPIPIVIVHGMDDPIIEAPGEDVWTYLTNSKEDTLLPVPLPGVRHFPMLEHESFVRLVSGFLEVPEISKLEVKERWRRRSR